MTMENYDDNLSAIFADGQAQTQREQAAAEVLERVRRRREAAAMGSPTSSAMPEQVRREQPEPDGESWTDKAGAVAKDVAMGATVEAPRALAHGALDAVNEGVQSIYQIGNWLRSNNIGPDGYLEFFGPDGLISWKSGNVPADKVPQVPNMDEPRSTTGRVLSELSQWITGMVLTGKAAPVAKATTKAGAVASAMGRGAVTDFAFMDEAGPSLSDLVQRVPELQNPVADFLSAKSDDSAVELRLKHALEGLGLGVATDAVMSGMKALRGFAKAKKAGGSEEQIAQAVREAQAEKDAVRAQYKAFSEKMGDPADDFYSEPDKRTKAAADVLGAKRKPGQLGIESSKEPGHTYINWSRINTPDDVKTVMQNMADKFKGRIDEARRGVMTFEEIKDAAQAEDAWNILMERRKGQPLNAEQSLAARNLWTSSADKLLQLAKAVKADPSDVNMVALRKQLVTHHAIETEVIAARTETARALASWRIPSESSVFDSRMLGQMVQQEGGGRDVTLAIAESISKLGAMGDIRGLSKFAEKSIGAKTKDAILEAWVAALLTNPKTHVVNTASNFLVLGQQLVERRAASALSSAMGSDAVAPGEALAMLNGISAGWRDALAYAAKTLRTGESGSYSGKIELPRQSAISAEAFGLSQDTVLGRAGGALANFAGSVVGVPGRALATADEFFKTIGSRMELHALAHRQTMAELSAGKIQAGQVKERYAELLDSPPAYMRAGSQQFADYCTFTNNPGTLANTISMLANKYAPIRILLPFVRTPSNIMQYVAARTPAAPLLDSFKADIAAGGARRDIALARMGLGTFTLFAMTDAAMSGLITGAGPKDKAQKAALRRTGWQPYSFKIGDKYYAFNRLDPLGAQLGFAADLGETLANSAEGVNDADLEELIVTATFSGASNMVSKTYLSGLTSFFEMMGDPDRYSESWLKRMSGSLVPAGVAQVARSIDPTIREAQSMLEAIQARTPGLSDSLPAVRDLWGRPVSYQSGMGWAYDAFSPVAASQYKPEPIDKEIMRLGVTVNKPSKKIQIDGVSIDLSKYPGAYSRYVELAGNGAKDEAWNLGAMDFLNQVVTGKHPVFSHLYSLYSDGPDGGKAEYIRSALVEYRDRAKAQLQREFPQISNDVDKMRAALKRFNFE